MLTDTTRQNTKSREARIRLRADKLYRRRGNRPGSALDDWLLAEKEIREDEERAIVSSSKWMCCHASPRLIGAEK